MTIERYYVLPPEQSRLLCRTSLFIIGSLFSAIRYDHYDLALLSLLSFMTSFFYWRNPIQKSWRQRLDRITVRSSFLFLFFRVQHQWHSIAISDRQIYIFLTGTSILLYLLAGISSRFSLVAKYSVYVHMIFHLLANISNMFIFSRLSSSSSGSHKADICPFLYQNHENIHHDPD